MEGSFKRARALLFLSCFALVCPKTDPQNLYLSGTLPFVRAATVPGPPDQQLLLALLDAELDDLRNLHCARTVIRYYQKGPGGELHKIDVIGAFGGYVNGQDEETPVTRNGQPLNRTMRELKGSWSTGEFGAILAEESAAVAGENVRLSVTADKDAYRIDYQVPASISAWDLQIGGRHWHPGYAGSISIDKASRHIAGVTRTVEEIAPECPVGKFSWRVDYEPRIIHERQVSVPVRARYENCQKASGRCAVNEIQFSDYREFRSDSTITFADARSRAVTGMITGTHAPAAPAD